jgi:GrpB-like predicted nucleotidyltransferase (UPF0157 family)
MTAEPLGLESKTVRVVPYDARWPALFDAEAARLREALAPLAVRIEHTGSTAVPGLAAKPILDILMGYESPETLPRVIAALVGAGYVHRGESGIPGREFFRRGEPRSWHIHLARVGSEFWREHLAFRDQLRGNPALRDAYATLKLDLARQYPMDREAYIEGKTAFVRASIAQADSP